VVSVGGMIRRKSKGDMTVSAKQTKVTVGGLAKLTSQKELDVLSDDITIEAVTKLTLSVGCDLSITLERDKISIKGKLQTDATDSIVVTGNNDLLT
jgi:hypothetical protein